MNDDVQALGEQAERSTALDHVARAGMVAYGVVHLLLAWLCVQLVLGGENEDASADGAFQALAGQPFGRVMVWAVALGMLLLVVCRLVEAGFGHHDEGEDRTRERLVSLGTSVVHAAIGLTAVRVALGGGSGGPGWTATVMGWPGGPWLVALAGLGVLAYAATLVRAGWTRSFAEDVTAHGQSGDVGRAFLLVGQVGHLGKGLALALVGFLTVVAGVTHDSEKGGGLDQALQQALQEPYGAPLIALVGAGLACFGAFCFVLARHLDR